MALGPGKYDDVCKAAREMAGIPEGGAGGVILIIFGGKHGPGFSCQADFHTTARLPEILENVARQIREDGPL